MTTTQSEKPFKDYPTRRMYDRWIKDNRVKSIEIKPVKMTVARVLADLSVRTDTLAVGRPGRTAKYKIEASALLEVSISENYFCALVQRGLRNIRGVRATVAVLTSEDKDGYLTFVYRP